MKLLFSTLIVFAVTCIPAASLLWRSRRRDAGQLRNSCVQAQCAGCQAQAAEPTELRYNIFQPRTPEEHARARQFADNVSELIALDMKLLSAPAADKVMVQAEIMAIEARMGLLNLPEC